MEWFVSLCFKVQQPWWKDQAANMWSTVATQQVKHACRTDLSFSSVNKFLIFVIFLGWCSHLEDKLTLPIWFSRQCSFLLNSQWNKLKVGLIMWVVVSLFLWLKDTGGCQASPSCIPRQIARGPLKTTLVSLSCRYTGMQLTFHLEDAAETTWYLQAMELAWRTKVIALWVSLVSFCYK